jgi:hypothetical protein
MSMSIIETQGYGYFGSTSELKKAISTRQAEGRSPYGEAIIFLGAEIIYGENGSISLAEPDRYYPRMEVRVHPTGKFQIEYQPDHEIGEIPGNWVENINP